MPGGRRSAVGSTNCPNRTPPTSRGTSHEQFPDHPTYVAIYAHMTCVRVLIHTYMNSVKPLTQNKCINITL